MVLTAVSTGLARADTPAPIPAVMVTPAEDAMLARWHDMADPATDAAVDDLYANNQIDAANTALKAGPPTASRYRPACRSSCTTSSPRT